jgi:ankyrin repeat protein
MASENPAETFLNYCRCNDLAGMAQMVESGFDLNAIGDDGACVLTAVISEGNCDPRDLVRIVAFMLANGADPNRYPPDAKSPLAAAIDRWSDEIVAMLLQAGADHQKAIEGRSHYDIAEEMVHGHVEALTGERVELVGSRSDRCAALLEYWPRASMERSPKFLQLLAAT